MRGSKKKGLRQKVTCPIIFVCWAPPAMNEENFMSFIREESGVTAIEYGLIAALIAIAIIVALTALGDSLSSNFDPVSSAVTGAI